MVDILRDVPMEYDRREQIATLRASVLVSALAQQPTWCQGARATPDRPIYTTLILSVRSRSDQCAVEGRRTYCS